MNAVIPESCPRFERCSANVCPLDADWRKRVHIEGERVCGLLTESVKPDAEARLRACTQGELVEGVLGQRRAICTRWSDVKRRLTRAERTGSRLENVKRLRGGAEQ